MKPHVRWKVIYFVQYDQHKHVIQYLMIFGICLFLFELKGKIQAYMLLIVAAFHMYNKAATFRFVN